MQAKCSIAKLCHSIRFFSQKNKECVKTNGVLVEKTLVTLMIHYCCHKKKQACSLKRQQCDIDAT